MTAGKPYLVTYGHRGEYGRHSYAVPFALAAEAVEFAVGCVNAVVWERDPKTGRYRKMGVAKR